MTQQKPLIIDTGTTQNLPAGDQLSINAGSAALPALTFGDADTGLLSSGTNEVAISTGGTQRVTVDANGNVGIGTAAPDSTLTVIGDAYMLKNAAIGAYGGEVGFGVDGVNGSAAITSKKVAGNGATDLVFRSWTGSSFTEKMTIAAGGNVGIGTLSPGSTLTVMGDTYMLRNVAVGAYGAEVGFGVDGVNGSAAITPKKAGGDGATDLVFRSWTGSSFTEKMTIAAGGNVGIGTLSPQAKLQVQAGDVAIVDPSAGIAHEFSIAQGANQKISFGYRNSSAGIGGLLTNNQGQVLTEAGATGGLILGTFDGSAPVVISQGGNPGTSTSFERMRMTSTEVSVNGAQEAINFRVAADNSANAFFVDASANSGAGAVGIGTALPNTTLEVLSSTSDGGVRVTGAGANTTPTYYIRTPDSGYGRMIWENAAGTDQWVYYAGTDGSGAQLAWSLNDAVAAKDRLTIWGGANKFLGMIVNTSSDNYDFTVKGVTDASTFVVDASANAVGIGTSTPSSAKLQVVAGSLAAGKNAVKATGTLADPSGGYEIGSWTEVATQGSTDGYLAAQYAALTGGPTGYTGPGRTAALAFDHTAEGTGTAAFTPFTGNLKANFGIYGNVATTTGTSPTGTGVRVGALGYSGGSSTLNVGVEGLSLGNAGEAVGVYGGAIRSAGSNNIIGGYFSLYTDAAPFSASLVNIDAALVADNGPQAASIFVARDNGSEVFRIADGGNVGVAQATPTSTMHVGGSLALAITTVTSATVPAALDATHYTVICDTSGGGFTVNLPAAATCPGRVYVVKNKSTNTATVQGNGVETIDSSNTYALSTQWQSLTIQSDGVSAWFII